MPREADWQSCKVHFYRDVWKDVPKFRMKEVTTMLKAIHAQEDYEAVQDGKVAVELFPTWTTLAQ